MSISTSIFRKIFTGVMAGGCAVAGWNALAADDIKPGDNVVLFQHDTRVINGVKVDLMPVHLWFTNHRGERPLKHWKRLMLIQFKPESGGWGDLCTVKDETGGLMEIYLKNLLPRVKNYITRITELKSRMATLSAQIEAEEKAARELIALTPTGGYYDDPYFADRQRANLALERVRQKKEDFAKLENEHNDLVKRGEELGAVLAMFTGQMKSKVQVWDCGVAVK